MSHPALIQSIQFLQWWFESVRLEFLTKLFFLVATVAMITEELSFSYFHGNHYQGNKFLHEDNAAYQSKASLKKWSQTDKESSKIVVIKVHVLFPIVMRKTAAIGSKHIKSYFSGVSIAFVIYLSGFYLFLKFFIFLNPLDG